MEQVIGAFLEFITAKQGLSRNTREAYRSDLTQFMRFLQVRNVRSWQVGEAYVQAYEADLLAREYGPATRARKLAAVRSFYRYLVREGVVDHDPTENLGRRSVQKRPPKVLGMEQVQALLEAAGRHHSPEGLRDHAMLQLLYSTGMRVSEVLSLNVTDLLLPQGRVVLRTSKRQRDLPIGQDTKVALETYLAKSRPQFLTSLSGEALFLSHRGQRLTRQGFWLLLKGYAKAARIEGEVTPRALRHSFAAHALQRKVPLRQVREMLGHASDATTQVYMKLVQRQEPEGSPAG